MALVLGLVLVHVLSSLFTTLNSYPTAVPAWCVCVCVCVCVRMCGVVVVIVLVNPVEVVVAVVIELGSMIEGMAVEGERE